MASGVPVVTDVPVSSSSVVAVMSEALLPDSDVPLPHLHPTSSTSSSQDTVISTENPAAERC